MSNFGRDGFDVPFAGTMKLRFSDMGPRVRRDGRNKEEYQQYDVMLGRYSIADAHKYADRWEFWMKNKGIGYMATLKSPEEFARRLEKESSSEKT